MFPYPLKCGLLKQVGKVEHMGTDYVSIPAQMQASETHKLISSVHWFQVSIPAQMQASETPRCVPPQPIPKFPYPLKCRLLKQKEQEEEYIINRFHTRSNAGF